MSVLRSPGGGVLVSGRGPLGNAPGNVAAPAIVQPPAGLLWDYSTTEGGAKLAWPLTNNQFDNLVAKVDGQERDWAATLSGAQERYGGVRYYYAWTNILAQDWDGLTTAYPAWQPAFREVFRVYRKGGSGQAVRTLVFECIHNTAAVPIGDTVWCYLTADFHGGVNPATSVNIQGWNLPLFNKMRCTGSTASPDWPYASRSTVEVEFSSDLPPIDWTPPTYEPETWLPPVPMLYLVHHSFYADAAAKKLRAPYDWHWQLLKDQVLANGGHVVLGGYQGIPTWRCWTHLFNYFGELGVELYRMEKQALADFFGSTDPRKVLEELENEPVFDWLDGTNHDNKLGFRRSLLEIMYPIARGAWGVERSFLLKGTSFGSINSLRDVWDLTNEGHFGSGSNFIGNHNYDDQAKYPDNRNLWYGSTEDCNYHAGLLKDTINRGKFKGGCMTEWGVPSWVAQPERAQKHGRLHTAMAKQGIPVAYWDLTGDAYGCSWLYRDVAGKEGKLVQAMNGDFRAYSGKAGRTT